MANQVLSEVRLLSVPLERNYKHTFAFGGATKQREYFISKTVHTMTNCTYVSNENVIRYPATYDDILNCNYVMYQNDVSIAGTKTFYAFIRKISYVNEGMCHIEIERDVLQTWLGKYTVNPSLIEREHTKDDTIGANLLDEGLQIGEYKAQLHSRTMAFGSMMICVGVTKCKTKNDGVLNDGWAMVLNSSKIHNSYSPIAYRCFPFDEEGIKKLQQLIFFYDNEGHGEDIACLFLIPSAMYSVGLPPSTLHDDDNFGGWIYEGTEIFKYYLNVTDKNIPYALIIFDKETIDGYNPKNFKLHTYPYRYLLVTNNNGVSVPFRYEDFKDRNPTFLIEGCLTPGCSIRLIPLNYKGIDRNDEEGINLGKFPILNWVSDMYTNWLTQNSVNIGIDIASGVIMTGISLAAGFATGGASSALTGLMAASTGVSGLTNIVNSLHEVYKASMSPAQSKGNTNNGDVITASGQNDFHFYDMCIKSQYARIVDDFFNAYGYKCNRIKTPNTWHRKYYWYTKTADASITANIPHEDIDKIKECYNNGITFWRYPDQLGTYRTDNTIE